MITCNRCGRSIHAGSAYCPGCGLPLSNMTRGGAGSSDQPELPAWLESLRVSERPVGAGESAEGQAGYSTNDFFEEGALPGWMRPENPEMPDAGNSGKYPAWRPASLPAPNTDSEFLPPAGFAAGSLIDEQSLPSWLQEKQPGAVQPASKNISASSLIQPEAIPDWLQKMSQPQQPSGNQPLAPGGNTPFSAQNNQADMTYPSPAAQGFSAHDLIDQQALPPWLAGSANSPAQTNQSSQQVGFTHSPVPPLTPGPLNPPSGIGASSLLDMNALPGWLRESEQGQGHTRQGYTQPQDVPPARPGQTFNGNTNGGGLTGASLIDMNALPNWLRSSEEGQGQQRGPVGNPRPTPYGSPPRAENIRVPSRPRGEVAPYDQSEVAANVFSSMLGVASTAPYFPPQPSFTSGPQQGLQGEQFQQQQLGQSLMQPPNPSGSPPQMNNVMPGIQAGFTGGNQPGRPGQQPPANWAGTQSYPTGSDQGSNAPSSGAKPARRGIIETIRSWFTH